jgi:hypothetical protein
MTEKFRKLLIRSFIFLAYEQHVTATDFAQRGPSTVANLTSKLKLKNSQAHQSKYYVILSTFLKKKYNKRPILLKVQLLIAYCTFSFS